MRTVWPRCRSGAVGSKPTLTTSGGPRLREAFQLGLELRGADDVHASLGEIGELFVDRHRRHAVPRNSLAALGFGSTAKSGTGDFRVNYTVAALTYSQPCPTLDGLQAFGAATS